MRRLFDRPLGTSVPNGVLLKFDAASLSVGADLASALIGGFFSSQNTTNSAVMQHNSNRILQKWQQAYTQQNMYDQYKYNMWAWNAENQYNSPQAYMERLRQAGLNPYLVSQGASGGAGMPQSGHPTAGSAPQGAGGSSPSVQPARMPQFNTASLIMQGSQIKNQQIEAFAKLADSAPKLVNAVGETAATRILESAFGQTVDNTELKRVAKSAVIFSESEAAIAEVKAQMDKLWSPRDREQNWAAGEQAISESFARVGKMSSDAKVNEAKINELASLVVRNVADAWKLYKEGEKYVADAATVNALRTFVVSQAKSYAQMASNQSFMTGADPISPIHDFLYSKGHVKSVIQGKSITDEQYSSELIRALDKVLGEYVKVSNGAAPTYNFGNTYNVP